MIRHVSLFEDVSDDELAELKAHAANWRADAEQAFLITGNIHERALMYELQDLHRELRVEQKYRAARFEAAVAALTLN